MLEDSLKDRLLQYRAELMLLGISLCIFMLSVVVFLGVEAGSEQELRIEKGETSVEEAESEDVILHIDISGAVMKPDVYAVSSSARLNDVIVLAGGLAANADRTFFAKQFNRAARLVDEQKVYIPTKSEVESGEVAGVNEKSSGSTSAQTYESTGESDLRIGVNTASQAALETLPGVGPVTAMKIIDGRPYSTIDELLERKIVNARVFESIKRDVIIN